MTDTLWTRRRAAQLPPSAGAMSANGLRRGAGGSVMEAPFEVGIAAAATSSPLVSSAMSGDYTDNVLFGDVWKRVQLSPRDRSLVTVASLVAQYRINELPFHLKFALRTASRGRN